MDNITLSFGGDALNEAVVLSQLGVEVELISKVGNDEAGKRILDFLKEKKVKTKIKIEEKLETGINIVLIDETGERNFLTNPNSSLRKLSEQDIMEHLEKAGDIVCMASLFVSSLLDIKTMERIFQKIKSKPERILVADITSPKNGERLADISCLLKYIDYIIPNETEAGRLTNETEAHLNAELFLEHRGFFRYRRPNGEYDYVRVEHPVVRTIRHYDVGDYVRSFTKDCLPKPILEMLYRGGSQYLGPDKLTMLDYFEGAFSNPARGVQRFFFADKWWQITSEGLAVNDYSHMNFHISAEDRKEFNAPDIQPLIKVETYEDGYRYEVTEAGKRCHFLLYLINASNFTWRKEDPEPEELADNAQHLINKLAAFGYMVASVKDKSCCKAVVGMDGKQSDIGESNGRSGKSLLGEAVKVISNTRHYNGKEFSTSGTRSFLWDGISEKTKCVFIDDAMKDFDFEILFSLITGEWPVNPKGEKPYILPFQKSPKIYVTTNHTMRGDGSSFIDRQWLIAFSDYYNDTHKPIDDFGVLFFDEWDSEQWNLFWNLVAQAVQIYFRYGYVPVPGDRLEKRKLQAEIGDEFIQWADEYYSDESKFNQRLARKEIYDALLEYVGPSRRQFYTSQRFSKCLFKWCRLREYIFNPHRFDPIKGEYIEKDDDGRGKKTDKSNGTEYFTIGDMSFYSSSAIPNFSEEIKEDEAIDLDQALYENSFLNEL